MKHNIIKLITLSMLLSIGIQAQEELVMKAKGKETIEVRFNGRFQAQYDTLTTKTDAADLPGTSKFYFRRLFLGAKAKLSNGMYGESVFDFADEGVGIDKAIVGHKFDNGVTGILGYQKVPFGFEETTSSSKLPTIERSCINRFFADDIDFAARHMGIHAKGKSGGVSYAWALVNSSQGLSDASRDQGNDYAGFFRIQSSFDDITIGVDLGQQVNNTVTDSDVTATTAYVNYKSDGLNLLAETFDGDLEQSGNVSGLALRASYKVGDLEPVVRYSKVESDTFQIDTDELIRRATNSGNITGENNQLTSYYAGLNYYYSKAATFMLGYESADAENTALGTVHNVDGFRARLQLLW